jgi:hypothetical protein
VDNPLSQSWRERQTIIHTHNLFLELAVGAGLPVLLAFLWFLWELVRLGLTALGQASGQSRVLVAGCIAGIVGTLGWGLLDVVEFSPPFLTTPTWVLVGLLLAAPQALNVGKGQRTIKAVSSFASRYSSLPPRHLSLVPPSISRLVILITRFTLILFMAFIAVVAPLVGNLHYRTAYIAFQERRWATAADELARATRWEPLSAKHHQLR